MYLIINKFYGYIGELNGNKYLTLLHTDKNKHTLKSKILLDQQVIAQTIIVKIYIKIRFDADDDVTVKRTLGLHSVKILFRSISKEGNK